LVECDLIEETPEHYIIDVDSLDTVVALSRSNSVTGIAPSNQRTHIVTVSRSNVSVNDTGRMAIGKGHSNLSIGHISNWVDIWNKLHK
jgi:hypothetical protein